MENILMQAFHICSVQMSNVNGTPSVAFEAANKQPAIYNTV